MKMPDWLTRRRFSFVDLFWFWLGYTIARAIF